jgi:hypothetical protein
MDGLFEPYVDTYYGYLRYSRSKIHALQSSHRGTCDEISYVNHITDDDWFTLLEMVDQITSLQKSQHSYEKEL